MRIETNITGSIRNRVSRIISIWLLPLSAAQADVLSEPEDVFAIVSGSIVVVNRYAIDLDIPVGKDGKYQYILDGFGSGVVIAPQTVLTNCHVALNAIRLEVSKETRVYDNVQLEYLDKPRDLCQLHVPSLNLPFVEVGDSENIRTGARVYAIGAPKGFELTLSEGIVSSSKRDYEGHQYIQTTAAISPGSSGGGLFDAGARLVGLTTWYFVGGESLNFAIPIHWLKDLPDRSAVQVAEWRRLGTDLGPIQKAAFSASVFEDWRTLVRAATQ